MNASFANVLFKESFVDLNQQHTCKWAYNKVEPPRFNISQKRPYLSMQTLPKSISPEMKAPIFEFPFYCLYISGNN